MLKTVLVDDEPLSLDTLEYLLDKHDYVEVVGRYTNAVQAIEGIAKLKPHLIFLDIQMPELDGFSVAKEVFDLGLDSHIVFATAYDVYAIKAFELNATDYILKPFSQERLGVSINRIITRLKNMSELDKQSSHDFIDAFANQSLTKIPVWKDNRIHLIDPTNILYFSVYDKKVMVYTTTDTFECNSSLSDLESKLATKGFLRCHKSFVVNGDAIDKIIPWFNSTYMLTLKGTSEEIPVSRSYTKKLRTVFGF